MLASALTISCAPAILAQYQILKEENATVGFCALHARVLLLEGIAYIQSFQRSLGIYTCSHSDVRCRRRGACFNKTADASVVAEGTISKMTMPAFKKFSAASQKGSKQAVLNSSASATAFQLHSPEAPDALILNEQQWQQQGQAKDSTKQPVAAVVVDPYMSRQLRPHQREGVKFLYRCVSSQASANHCGAILADEMGLGKKSDLQLSAYMTHCQQISMCSSCHGPIVQVLMTRMAAYTSRHHHNHIWKLEAGRPSAQLAQQHCSHKQYWDDHMLLQQVVSICLCSW